MSIPSTRSGVVDRLGVRLHGDAAAALLGLALRDNPRRAQLLVSRVLGKHIPTDPRVVRGAGLLLGGRVADALAGAPPRDLPADLLVPCAVPPAGPAPDVLVLGFAETATALGHCVAEGLGGVDYLHSTRRAVPGHRPAGGFAEEHSHAVEHLLLPADPAILHGDRPLVLVDDELSTGRTVLNTITALHRAFPQERYVVAALVDVRGSGRSELAAGVRALGASVEVVTLATAELELPPDVLARAAALRAEIARTNTPARSHADPGSRVVGRVELGRLGWPRGVPVGGRHGFGGDDHAVLAAALPGLAAGLARAAGLDPAGRTLVLGTEELMQLPLRLAQELADTGHRVRFSTTTRSPAVVVDEPGYALRSGLTFPAPEGTGPRYAYNLGGERWDHVVVVVDPPADTPALATGLLAALAPHTRRTTLVITP